MRGAEGMETSHHRHQLHSSPMLQQYTYVQPIYRRMICLEQRAKKAANFRSSLELVEAHDLIRGDTSRRVNF